MERQEIIRRLVLNSICDDYEDFDQIILPDVHQCGARLGLSIDRSDVVEALGDLIGSGLAKAYCLSGVEPHATEVPGMPSLDVVEEDFKICFYITPKGMDLHLADDDWWLFDD